MGLDIWAETHRLRPLSRHWCRAAPPFQQNMRACAAVQLREGVEFRESFFNGFA